MMSNEHVDFVTFQTTSKWLIKLLSRAEQRGKAANIKRQIE
jgi:hypothetical protein